MHKIVVAEKKNELLKVQANRSEMELNILRKEDEIERLKLQIDNQLKREEELKLELEGK